MPKISVNITTKDRSGLLVEALQSVLNQKEVDFEIVLVNDGSTDGTEEVVKQAQSKIPSNLNLIYIHNEVSVGVGAARQQALEKSSGQYIAPLDDDDLWVDELKLAKQSEFLDKHLDVGIVGSAAQIYDYDTKQEKLWKPLMEDSSLRTGILYRTPFLNTAIMFRRELAIKAGGYKVGQKFSEDYLLWLKMGQFAKFANMLFVGTKVRSSEAGLTRKNASAILWSALKHAFEFRGIYPGFAKAVVKLGIQYIFVLIFGISNFYKLKELLWSKEA